MSGKQDSSKTVKKLGVLFPRMNSGANLIECSGFLYPNSFEGIPMRSAPEFIRGYREIRQPGTVLTVFHVTPIMLPPFLIFFIKVFFDDALPGFQYNA